MWIIKRKGQRDLVKYAWEEELREMHTLIERPAGQRKYLRENENFILGVFMKPYSDEL